MLSFLFCLAITNNDYISNEKFVILNKKTFNDSLGIIIIILKHCVFNLYAVFIEDIQSKSLAHL
jgi:hypothetical protein